MQLTDKMVEKFGVQRTPTANPEMYKSDDYSAHLKGENRTMEQRERDEAGKLHHKIVQSDLRQLTMCY